MSSEPATTTVEWGSTERPSRIGALVSGHRWRAPATWALAALGVLAMSGSLIAEWQVIDAQQFFGPGSEAAEVGIARIAGWGPWWMFGVTVLVVLVVLALFAQQGLRTYSRSIGLAITVALCAILVPAAISLTRESSLFGPGFPMEFESSLGPGVHLAFAAVVLLGGSLWLARPADAEADTEAAGAEGSPHRRWWPAAPQAERADPVLDGPHDLSVSPAEPDTLQG